MAVKIQTPAGTIEITNDVIATVVGGAATDIYGIVGMASKNQIKDNLNDILRRENYSRGVVVRQEDNGIAVDVYTIVSYGTKISEVSRNVQEKVKYNLETLLGVTANSVNVFVQGVRVLPVAVNLKEDFLGECNRNQRRSVPGNGPGRCDSSAHKCRICQLIKRFPCTRW